MITTTELAAKWGARAQWYEDRAQRLGDCRQGYAEAMMASEIQRCVTDLSEALVTELPMRVRAPEVGRLLASIREECEDESGAWDDANVCQLLSDWFTALGYQAEGATK
jgi:hypothetical protein